MLSGNRHTVFKIFLFTLFMTILYITAIICACAVIKDDCENSCRELMANSASYAAEEIKAEIEGDKRLVENIAELIASRPEFDLSYAMKMISGFEKYGAETIGKERHIIRLELLLPDGSIASGLEINPPSPKGLNFSEEEEKGAYISPLIYHKGLSAEIIRICAPIVVNGKTEACLYALIDIASFPEMYKPKICSSKECITLIEGSNLRIMTTSEFGAAGNKISFGDFEFKNNDNKAELTADFKSGKSGFTILRSRMTGKFSYYCYQPVGINNWMIMFSVPESAISVHAKSLVNILFMLSGATALIMIFYFGCLLLRYKRHYTYMASSHGVSHKLLDSYNDESKFGEALTYIAKVLTAKEAFFIVLEGDIPVKFYSGGSDTSLNAAALLPLSETIRQHDSVISRERIELSLGNGKTYVIKNYIASAVKNNGVISGIIGVVNMRKKFDSTELLNNMAVTFAMALHGFNSYNKIHYLSTVDAMTGLLNRYMFNCAMNEFSVGEHKNFSAVYIDANGLHSLNNSQGHEAGDKMLCCIAKNLTSEFGTQYCFRIGGDEFAVFAEGLSQSEVNRKIKNVCKKVEEQGYHISVGLSFSPVLTDVTAAVNAAEAEMQNDKYLYYQRANESFKHSVNDASIRRADISKRDSEIFLSAIAPHFRGCYMVNLKTDEFRIIYIQKFFEKIIEETGGKFIPAIRAYAASQVSPDSQREFSMFFDYKWLMKLLSTENFASLRYNRADGTSVRLIVSKSLDYTDDNPDTVWIFERV